MALPPVRIDILTHISGIQFAEAWQNRVASTFFGVPVYFISLDDLIINKKAAGRGSDLEQLERLRRETKKKATNRKSRQGPPSLRPRLEAPRTRRGEQKRLRRVQRRVARRKKGSQRRRQAVVLLA